MINWTDILKHPRAGKWLDAACAMLVIVNLLSLPAAHSWFFDLFVNFRFQYFIAAVTLAPICLVFGKKWHALGMAALAVILFAAIQMSYSGAFYKPLPLTPNLTVVQYNKFYYNESYDDIGQWLRASRADFDIVIVNESNPESFIPLREKFGDIFPHQFPTHFLERYNDIAVLSRWPVTVAPMPMKQLNGSHLKVSKITLTKDGLQPVTIYAYHTQTPVGPNDFALRNFELESFADIVRRRTENNVLMMGDWNVTPYSPFFQRLLERSGMNYYGLGLFPPATFPAQGKFDLLQIPIDHILYDDSMVPLSIAQGPSNGSDHQSLIGKFYVKTME